MYLIKDYRIHQVMAQFIELQRGRLQEIDVIRYETYKRFRKNPQTVPHDIRSNHDVLVLKEPRPYRETIVQKHELRVFKENFCRQVHKITGLRDKQAVVNEALGKVTDDKRTFSEFDKAFDILRDKKYDLVDDNISSVYAMYSSSPADQVKMTSSGKLRVKRKYILSQQGSRVDFSVFSPQEQWGKFIDIRQFQASYEELTNTKLTYLEYLKRFDDVVGVSFENYIEAITDYLYKFIERRDPYVDLQDINREMEAGFQSSPTAVNGMIYCKYCRREFKQNSYESHVLGKKHKKNVGNATIGKSEFQLHKLKFLTAYLAEPIKETINNIERINAMTEREKLMETTEIADDSEFTTANSQPSDLTSNQSDDDHSDEDLIKQLPLDADGMPIPFWLYKLQGLNHSYNCEICGNISYQGRVTFEKHFSNTKHQQGLRFLGIDYDSMSLFANINQIDEAVELWKTIKRQRKLREGEIDNVVEVEDKQGNVMSERDYLQLKRQGMI